MQEILNALKSISEVLVKNQIAILIGVSLCFVVVIAISIFKNKKIPLAQGIIFLTSIVLVIVNLLLKQVGLSIYDNNSNIIDSSVTAIYIIALIVTIILFIIDLTKKETYKLENQKVLMFSDLDKTFVYTKEFLNDLGSINNKKSWKKMLLLAYVDNEEVAINDLDEKLKEDKDYFSLMFVFNNYEYVSLKVAKKEYNQNNKFLGYVYTEEEVERCYCADSCSLSDMPENSNNIAPDKLVDALDKAYACLTSDTYYLNKSMRYRLDVNYQKVSVGDLRNYVYKKDLPVYDACKKQMSGTYKYQYRLRTRNGLEWFEEIKNVNEGNSVSYIYQYALEKLEAPIFKNIDLIRTLDQRLYKKHEFGLIFVNLNKCESYANQIGQSAYELIVNKYFDDIQKKYLTKEDNIYNLSNFEYCIIVDDLNNYEKILEGVKNNDSELLDSVVEFSKRKYQIANVLGFINSKDVLEQSSKECLENGRLVVHIVNEKNDGSRYGIYDPKDFASKGLEFDNYKVDLDNTFLKNI